jgi:hypothetical protein
MELCIVFILFFFIIVTSRCAKSGAKKLSPMGLAHAKPWRLPGMLLHIVSW